MFLTHVLYVNNRWRVISADAVPGGVTNGYQIETQLRLVIEVVSAVASLLYIELTNE